MASVALKSGGGYQRVVSTRFYSRESLSATHAAFRKHCAVTIEPVGADFLRVTIEPIGEAAGSAREAILEFWNFALDTEAQARIGS